MFSIVFESLKFDKLPSKKGSRLYLVLLGLALFMFYQFPPGDPRIKVLDQLAELDWQNMMLALQKLLDSKQLLSLFSRANMIYYLSDFGLDVLMLLTGIFFLAWQIACYKKMKWQLVCKRFFKKLLTILAFLLLVSLTVIAFVHIFSMLPTIAIAFSLFIITQALFVPTVLIDYDYNLGQAFVVSRQLMQGFKLNFLLTFTCLHFMFKVVPELVIITILPSGILLNLALAIVRTVYMAVCLRCLFIYYLYLSEYFYPQIRSLGIMDLGNFLKKLNNLVYPLYTEAEKARFMAEIKREYAGESDLEKALFSQEFKSFKSDILDKKLPLEKPIDNLLAKELKTKPAEAEPIQAEPVVSTQNVEEKAALLSKNLQIISVKLQAALAKDGLCISKEAYLTKEAEEVASNFYRSKQQLADLNRLISQAVDYLKRSGKTTSLVEEKEGLN